MKLAVLFDYSKYNLFGVGGPELKCIAVIEWGNEAYQFDLTGVWRRESDGTLWFDSDSGCSCPTPWESTTELDRLFSIEQLEEIYKSKLKSYSYQGGGPRVEDWQSFRDKVLEAMGKG